MAIMDTNSGEQLVAQAQALLAHGRLPAKVFSDPALHQLEVERIFGRAWIFLAHETEIPAPGDYVMRHIVDDEFIVVRDDEGGVRVLFNSCRHRGMRVAQAGCGHAKTFRCPYHGWVYRNDGRLQGVPYENRIYGPGEIKKEEMGLLAAPRSESWNGMIFASLSSDGPTLTEFLGNMAFYLEFYTRKSEAGLQVVGEPQRWVVRANWKLGASNFIGDGYHTSTTHFSTVKVGVLPGSADFLIDGVQVDADSGGLGFRRMPPGTGSTRGYGPEVMARFEPAHRAILESGCFPSHGTVFPNLSFLAAAAIVDQGGAPVPYFTLRIWQPVAHDTIEIWSWMLIDKSAPEALKRASYTSYVLSFGSSGLLEQDDTENWTSITRSARGRMAGTQELSYVMGSTSLPLMTDWPGPGKAYSMDYTEAAERSFYQLWLRYLQEAT
ncbi:aromatic ring-hydroxylating dioxygenase subunit alpha [Ramlibacter rhizophilus]|uniref:Aromatic ring-hydroxylating dioxygenase subunit alpha n=1 Tax=Ramlibacter rhizophilus TaxID=1781167 RepID=A0A4Z0BN00_9BURK|nr:aromatic ring-hydroxylating dioxygenase subunit alpha [Ramlibacter rhizophilus]TFY99793.1 aromatic ring-hydroxylating dioxygenase subunit alpha [Ramlibacter rhizophilus]